ncbi:MAG: cupin domain-containing protein [Bacteroidales bacterium]|jgi:quercetin dioxygenase-like cupin family protein|nr:cupin domain-containing protein [Bacteroidales bacterium]HOY39818.1 cupin domain-containing protein [Bacteroidales bacterium]HQP05113.1 cupin domain-containing protein [Bacteroidales bacterium]
MEATDFPRAEVMQLKSMVEYQQGAIVSRTIIKKLQGNLSLFAFDKGESLSEHTAPFDAMIQVLDGSAEVIIGGKPYRVSCCETIIMPANIPHAVNAVEKFKMLLTMIKE